MSVDFSSDLKFEIGHALFIDTVVYSNWLIAEQSESYISSRQKNGLEKVALPQ